MKKIFNIILLTACYNFSMYASSQSNNSCVQLIKNPKYLRKALDIINEENEEQEIVNQSKRGNISKSNILCMNNKKKTTLLEKIKNFGMEKIKEEATNSVKNIITYHCDIY